MTNENDALSVLHDSAENADLKAQITALQDRLAQFEGPAEILRPQFNGEVPRYRLNTACYLEDDTLHVEGEEIEYLNTPNDQMVPLNEAARVRLTEYLEQLREGQRMVAEKNGRSAPGIVILDKGELVAQMGRDARNEPAKVQAVRMPEEKGQVFPMPHMAEAKAQAVRRGKAPKGSVVVSAKPPTPVLPQVKTKPEPILGTRYGAEAAGNNR